MPAVTHEMVLLYWQIGRDILQRQAHEGWEAKVIDRLAADLHHAFPDMPGFSPRNLKYMRAFAEGWPDEPIVQQLVAGIPWGHCVRLLDYVRVLAAGPTRQLAESPGAGRRAEARHPRRRLNQDGSDGV